MAVKPLDLYGIGNAIVDLLVEVDDLFLQRFHIQKGIMHLTDPSFQSHILREIEERGLATQIASGGSVANSVALFAQLGGRAVFTGKVGNDLYGKLYREDLERQGVRFETPSPENDGQTGTSIVLITPDGKRTFLTHLGVSVLLSPNDLQASTIGNAKILFIEGYLLDSASAYSAAQQAAKTAKQMKTQVAFSMSDPFLVKRYRDAIEQWIRDYVDILFLNEEEANIFCQKDPLEELPQYVATFFLTQGENGAVAYSQGVLYHERAQPVKAVDTTGAGDVFAGACLYGLIHHLSIPNTLKMANLLAGEIVCQIGPRFQKNIMPLVETWISPR